MQSPLLSIPHVEANLPKIKLEEDAELDETRLSKSKFEDATPKVKLEGSRMEMLIEAAATPAEQHRSPRQRRRSVRAIEHSKGARSPASQSKSKSRQKQRDQKASPYGGKSSTDAKTQTKRIARALYSAEDFREHEFLCLRRTLTATVLKSKYFYFHFHLFR